MHYDVQFYIKLACDASAYGIGATLVTDHKPLVTMLGSRSPMPTLAAARLQHWALLLSGYQYKAEFHPTAHLGNTDCLSRLPIHPQPENSLDENTLLFHISQIDMLPAKAEQLQQVVIQDPVLSRVFNYIVHGWPFTVGP